ncbi:hypothetical protein [Streptomyces sp. NPDC086787]|uniref:hypothetical protein n=1 Tax=Streptomyces sp. NPDC086787 TaxID=3365759 RepID=UPI003809E7AC
MTGGGTIEGAGGGEPDERHTHEHTHSHAGNGTVNHGPDGKGPEELGSDELALRRMLHSAVQDMEPRDGTLDHLRRAVPARRARRRHAAVGMAAAAVLLATAVPALVHVTHSGDSDPNTSMAGQASQAHDGTSHGTDQDGWSGTGDGSGDQPSGQDRSDLKGGGKSDADGAGTTGPTDGAHSSASAGSRFPGCTATQLGSPVATVDAPDSAGVVYGTFRVANVSTTACGVGGAGNVNVQAQGAADAGKVSAVRHTAGDAAAGLPTPSEEATGLTLKPGEAYEEKFAFVPAQSCPADGGGDNGGTGPGEPSSDPTPSPDTGAGTDAGNGVAGDSPQLTRKDGSPVDGSVVVSHTPEAGSPTGTATVTGACAGTVYWTGVLSAS